MHGFARVQFINGSDIHVNATSFPVSVGVSSSFNRSLWGDVGGVVGRRRAALRTPTSTGSTP